MRLRVANTTPPSTPNAGAHQPVVPEARDQSALISSQQAGAAMVAAAQIIPVAVPIPRRIEAATAVRATASPRSSATIRPTSPAALTETVPAKADSTTAKTKPSAAMRSAGTAKLMQMAVGIDTTASNAAATVNAGARRTSPTGTNPTANAPTTATGNPVDNSPWDTRRAEERAAM